VPARAFEAPLPSFKRKTATAHRAQRASA
jgi:hypothetical protein